MYTSGTTGNPKGVILEHRHLHAAVQNVIASHQLEPSDTTYCFLPLCHINAQVIVLLSTLASGGKIIMQKRFSASNFWKTVRQHRITWVSAVPAILSILVKTTTSKNRAGCSSLRFVRSASAPLSPDVAREFEHAFNVPVIESYGMTEAAGQICVNPLSPQEHRLGSVGKPCGVSLRIVDADLRPVPTGQVGQIEIRGESVIQSYIDVVEQTTGFHEGWLLTGDLGRLDESGFLYITGRLKEMINRAGEKISPREVEDVLTAHPSVEIAAVIGMPDEVYGEIVVGFVVPRSKAMKDSAKLASELMSRCSQALTKPKRPNEIRIVNDLPVGATGKVQKHLLKQSYVNIG